LTAVALAATVLDVVDVESVSVVPAPEPEPWPVTWGPARAGETKHNIIAALKYILFIIYPFLFSHPIHPSGLRDSSLWAFW